MKMGKEKNQLKDVLMKQKLLVDETRKKNRHRIEWNE